MDGMSGVDTSASFTIPTNFLLDLSFPVDAALAADPSKFHVYRISSYTAGYVVELGYNGSPIGAFSVATAQHTWGKVYVISGQGDYEKSTGLVAIGDLSDIEDEPTGIWTFLYTAAGLQPRCIVPSLQGLTGLRILSGGVLSSVLTGNVILSEGRNSQLRVSGNTVIIDAIGDDDFTADCTCDNQRDTGTPIRRFNGVSPAGNGDFYLVQSTCIDITAATNGLVIANPCSDPCCGCEELSIVNQALSILRNQYTTLSNYASRLDNRIGEMDTVFTQTIASLPEN